MNKEDIKIEIENNKLQIQNCQKIIRDSLQKINELQTLLKYEEMGEIKFVDGQ